MAVRVVTDQTPLATPVVVGRQGAARALARALVRNRKALAGLSVFGFFVLVAIFAPLIAPYDPSALAFNQMLQPSRAHLLGTTGIGQDIFSQLVFGTRESLLIALAAGLAATAVSVIVGVSAAYLGGLWDHALNLFTDVFLVLPTLPLMIIVGTYLNNRGLLVLIGVITVTGWSYGARQLRSQALSLRNREFLEAARVRGDRSAYIIVFEVLPNMTSLIVAIFFAAGVYPVRAVDRVSLEVCKGEFLGIVGESGCGKSTLLYAIARLLTPPAQVASGDVRFEGSDIVSMTDSALRHLRWKRYSVVMQSAMNALNPVMSVGEQLRDAFLAHESLSGLQIATRSAELMRLVGIDPVHLGSYPHQLSGGMRQRAMIAMALAFTPELVIMDEPTSALDVVAQRSLMLKIKQLQREFGFATIFVTHDMSLVSHFSDRLAVMYAGQIVEVGETRQRFADPKHPYTVGLMRSFPSITGALQPLSGIPGSPPDLAHPPAGCRFHPRCPQVMARCKIEEPAFYEREGDLVRCFLFDVGS